MDAVTALSGSGPAYVCYLLEAMLEAGARMGLPASETRQLALATVSGTIRLLVETGQNPAEARARVTSKNGATEAALRVLAERSVREAWLAAIDASRTRSAELGKSS
jgi:pyrroline-5-carboxylate reductase